MLANIYFTIFLMFVLFGIPLFAANPGIFQFPEVERFSIIEKFMIGFIIIFFLALLWPFLLPMTTLYKIYKYFGV